MPNKGMRKPNEGGGLPCDFLYSGQSLWWSPAVQKLPSESKCCLLNIAR